MTDPADYRRRFEELTVRKTREAAGADIQRLVTVDDRTGEYAVHGIGNVWTRAQYDGNFALFEPSSALPAVSLVFVQSREGNTGANNPSELGGGPTDLHLIYEGLSRVAADAVLAGASTVAGPSTFFSVWHPELVALRQALGLPRHPAQIVASKTGHIDPEHTLLFNVPEVPVFVLAGAECRDRCAAGLARRPWITVVDADQGFAGALAELRSVHGIRRVSAVGGRSIASHLIDEGLVQDLCLTTTDRSAGEPGTPFYVGHRQLSWRAVVRKKAADGAFPIQFDHLALTRD